MITYFSVRNYKTFYRQIELDFRLSKRIKRFLANGVQIGDSRYLKTVGIYGPNNAGKTCLLLSIINLRTLMFGGKHEPLTNSFVNDQIIDYRVDYIEKGIKYRYVLRYDSEKKVYLHEKLSIISSPESNSYVETEQILIEREKRTRFKCVDWDTQKCDFMKENLADSQPIMMMLHFGKEDKIMSSARNHYIDFLLSISDVIRLDDNINTSKTIELLRTDSKAAAFIKTFVKNCDLHIDDFGIQDNVVSDVDLASFGITNLSNENYKFVSVHNEYRVPSFLFDSIGTRKLIALSGYIYDAIKNGKILLIDEIDSSLHHIITRAIVSLFNNDLNKKSQLIFSTHDAELMDLTKLLRKDQIYLVDFDNETKFSKIVHLSDISSKEEDGIRGNEDIRDYYMSGKYGAVPTPNLFEALLEAIGNER